MIAGSQHGMAWRLLLVTQESWNLILEEDGISILQYSDMVIPVADTRDCPVLR